MTSDGMKRRDFLKSLSVGAAVALFPVACSYQEDDMAAEGHGEAAKMAKAADPFAGMDVHTRTDPGAWGGKEDGHIPQATLTKLDDMGNYRVDVTVQHEMTPDHWIKHIWLRDGSGTAVADKVLQPSDSSPASATFSANAANVDQFVVYELCNLHGLWKAEYDIPMS